LVTALLAALYAPGAMAQEQPSASDANKDPTATDLDTVTVTGYRYSIEKSLDQKRNANAIVDVITAEDVSKFPDKNVADALQRVPGVVITRDGGEGKNVSVRGLSSDLTLTQLNGNYIASSETNNEASRSFNYTLLPAHMLGSAELFKTPEARLDEGGIGGTVILHSRRPLDMESNTGFVTLEGTYADTTKTTDPQLSAQYSWHSKDERHGFLVGATKQKRTARTMGAETENWQWYSDGTTPQTDVNGNAFEDNELATWWGGNRGINTQTGQATPQQNYNNFALPTSVNFGVREEERERSGLQLTYQFKPTDDLTLTANYFRFDLKGDYTFNQLKIPEWNLSRVSADWAGEYHGGAPYGEWQQGRLLNQFMFDPSGTIVTGAEYEKLAGKTYYCNDAQANAGFGVTDASNWGSDSCTVPTPQLTGGYSREETTAQVLDFAADWNVSDLFRVHVAGGTTWSDGGPSMNFRMSAKPRRPLANGDYQAGNTYSAWDISGTPTATFSPNLQDVLMAGVAEIDLGSTDSSWMETSVEQDYFQIDATKMFETGWLESLQFGVKFRDGQVHRNTGNTYWTCPGAPEYNGQNRGEAWYQGCDGTAAGVAQPGFFLSKPIDNIAGGFNANVFPGIDFPGYVAYLNDRYGDARRYEEPDFVYNVGEEVHAGYLQANFRTERLRGNVGVRLVKTDQRAEATDSIETFVFLLGRDANGNLLPCDDANPAPAGAFCQGGYQFYDRREKTFELVSLDKSYTDVLPSFNIAWDVTDDIVLRGAASKVIARPVFTDIARPGGLQYVSPQYAADRAVIGGGQAAGWYGGGANRDLDPFEATQYDISAEWYFQPGAVLGLGLFRKEVKNFVVPAVFDQTLVVGGETVTVNDFSTQVNGRDGVSQGVEAYAQYTFDFGLGFQANYTYNDTNLASVTLADGTEIGKSPLIGSAKNQANFTVFYENDKFLARASYNRRGEIVGGLHNGMNIYTEPYQQVDLNFGYNILENLSVNASVLNLTKEESRSHLGNDTDARFFSNSYAGRIMYLGLTYKF
jgi:TonB-dependent receptor